MCWRLPHSASTFIGVTLRSEGDIYGQHEEIIRRTALRAQCVLRRRILWGFNRYLMVRDMWKLVHVPALTFCNATICLSHATREWLERRQRDVGRAALGSHGAVPNRGCCREDTSDGPPSRHFMRKERFARQVFEYLAATCMRTDWTDRIYRLEKKYGCSTAPIECSSTPRRCATVSTGRVAVAAGDEWQELTDPVRTTQADHWCGIHL
ncbi:hypothetical protein HPB50_005185 [Hyalomma asiaticum]|uniref:Uncharacterized protein n=1 Tax=Hyalomma asiaticum TaxID=266040 RepID=A0ACB7S406_HYAAI|nr:hypothetical protein HPB50_005185 [Hyalomma asiaticum]